MEFRKVALSAISVVGAIGLTACGGGGGDSPSASPPSTPSTSSSTTYTASAAAGELLTYTVDTSALTYSYTITESAWGLAGQSGSGTLTRNADGTYTPSEAPNARLVIGNGVMVGVVRQVVGGTIHYIPIYGVTGLITNFSDLAGIYNFVMRSCSSVASCSATHGTFRVNSGGTWESCRGGNIAATTPVCSATGSGALTDLGGGKFQITGTNAIAFATRVNTSKVLVLDYYQPGLGQSLVGVNQAAMGSNTGDGTWFSYTPTYNIGAKMTVSGNTASIRKSDTVSFGNNVVTQDASTTFTRNDPWPGMVRTSAGYGVVDVNGALYGYVRPTDGYTEFGIRTQ